MKKPGKSRPKKRVHKPAPVVARAPANAEAFRTSSTSACRVTGTEPLIKLTLPSFGATEPPTAKLPPTRRAPPARVAPRPEAPPIQVRPVPSNRASVTSSDDRATMALLMVPFLIVAGSLLMTQTRRPGLPEIPDVVARAPLQQPLQTISAPGSITYPPAPASIEIAMLDQRPASPPAVEPNAPPLVEVIVPGPAPAYPLTAPEIPLIAQLPALSAPDVLAYPPPVAAIEEAPERVASLDMRPITPPPALTQEPAETVCRPSGEQLAAFSRIGRLARVPRQPLLTGVDADTFGRRLSDAALAQTRDLVVYTARYQAMAYPLGDVVPLHGACIDVVIRAYRQLGIDLQEEVQKARGRRGDPNIDHRRTENMRRFLEQKGASLPITHFPENFKPGDIVTYHRPFSRVSTSHIAIVTDIIAPTGRPMIVHNRGYGAQLEDALFVDRITGHYRYHGPAMPAPRPAAAGPSTPSAPLIRASLPGASSAP